MNDKNNESGLIDYQTLVTVIVVTYNSAHCIPQLADGLMTQPHLIFVDNASSDDTVARIGHHLPQARVIQQKQNMGFGAANNAALHQVTTPYALLLNPDCQISAEKVVGLVKCAQRYPDAAMIAPQLTDNKSHKSVNYSWVKHLWKSKGEAATGDCCVGFATGAVLLVQMENTRALGYFDENFFLYYEDDDLCNKYFDAKKAIVLTPYVQIQHSSRGSVKTNNVVKQEYWRGYHHAQSKVWITQKYQGVAKAKKVRLKTLVSGFFMSILHLLTLNFRLFGRMAGRFIGMLTVTQRFNTAFATDTSSNPSKR
ncbi:MAG: putative glycosyltransferase [Burkholderiaceae bacterium]|nr:putative glycosyltransferase [Burkholderiaceae bacterium]